jgi:hypothetical protein
MLASILPGIRDLRAPLVAGYTFLISLWLFIAPDGKPPSSDSGYGLLYRLGQFTGRAGVVAAASVVAYFLGTLLQQAGRVFPAVWSRVVLFRTRTLSDIPREGYAQLGYETSVRLIRWLESPPDFKVSEDYGPSERLQIRARATKRFHSHLKGAAWDTGREFRRVIDDIPLISGRMRELAKERFDEFDKLRSEAEFREALTPAVLLLTVALCYRWSLWWALLLLFVVWLQREAYRLRVQANSVAIEAVMTGRPGIYPPRDELASLLVDELGMTASG